MKNGNLGWTAQAVGGPRGTSNAIFGWAREALSADPFPVLPSLSLCYVRSSLYLSLALILPLSSPNAWSRGGCLALPPPRPLSGSSAVKPFTRFTHARALSQLPVVVLLLRAARRSAAACLLCRLRRLKAPLRHRRCLPIYAFFRAFFLSFFLFRLLGSSFLLEAEISGPRSG